jgi:hypothetical protein
MLGRDELQSTKILGDGGGEPDAALRRKAAQRLSLPR